jgi:hypothetical protein
MEVSQISFVIPTSAPTWMDMLAKFQSGLVGLLGFFGVMMTLWWNARLARQARQETYDREAQSLRSSLIEELEILRLDMATNYWDIVDALTSGSDVRTLLPFIPITVYPEVIDKLGTLRSREIRYIIRA